MSSSDCHLDLLLKQYRSNSTKNISNYTPACNFFTNWPVGDSGIWSEWCLDKQRKKTGAHISNYTPACNLFTNWLSVTWAVCWVSQCWASLNFHQIHGSMDSWIHERIVLCKKNFIYDQSISDSTPWQVLFWFSFVTSHQCPLTNWGQAVQKQTKKNWLGQFTRCRFKWAHK